MTRRVALIGSPLSRRHSEVMHNAAFADLGIDACYELRPLSPDALSGFVAEARGPAWLGFQVTSPYKQDVLVHCDEIDPETAAIGAVNTVVRLEGGRLRGANTDALGFLESVRTDLRLDLGGAAVAVAGAGGAARAVVAACVRAGAERVTVAARRGGRASEVAEAAGETVEGLALESSAFATVLGTVDLAVNATTVGMTAPGVVLDVALLREGAAVFDLVYAPAVTDLVATARKRGLAAVSGGGMLVAQAAAAFEMWTGIAGAGPVMAAAVAPLLASGTGDAP